MILIQDDRTCRGELPTIAVGNGAFAEDVLDTWSPVYSERKQKVWGFNTSRYWALAVGMDDMFTMLTVSQVLDRCTGINESLSTGTSELSINC